MFNLLRMDLRRLFRTRSFYIVLAVTAAMFVFMTAMMAAVADPERLEALENTGMVVTDRSNDDIRAELMGMTQLEFAHECMGSGFLLIMTGIGVTLFVHNDFSSGFVKNICFARPRRREYVLSKVLVTGVYSVILTALSILLLVTLPILAGLPLTASPVGYILQYSFWIWLPCWAFGLTGALLVLLTRGTTLGILVAVFSGGGVVAMLVQNLCQQFGWPNLAQYMLSMVVNDQCGPILGPEQINMILGCTAWWAGIYLAGSLVAMEKRDI